MELAQSSNARRQICAVIDEETYGQLLNISQPRTASVDAPELHNDEDQDMNDMLPAMIPFRRRSRSSSLAPVRDSLMDFPPAVQAAASTSKERTPKTPDQCKRCSRGGAGTHSRLACLADQGPRPVSQTGKNFKTPCPGFAESYGAPYPLPAVIFDPKQAQLVQSGFEEVTASIKDKLMLDRSSQLTREEINFCRFIGSTADTFVVPESYSNLWFTMSSYIDWSTSRIEAEASGRKTQAESRKRGRADTSQKAAPRKKKKTTAKGKKLTEVRDSDSE